jgi:hypothetical protein
MSTHAGHREVVTATVAAVVMVAATVTVVW